ncbi:Helix-turn-helix domain-containing protein [Hespellia stercorisuis DSM 15480]|uniref:Helix-turn-helix domain-containing protein n=2 Tax=Hespellia stercorisuis TaxID=180311 RepID=A0A1M6TKN0_9FIRM|nr:Helix-turn-helix domain-containing protein [Hespellia stercorisuis DSM 15480]
MRMIETLGSRLRQLRISKHLKQEQVAALIDVNKSSICTYENNMRQPSLDILVRLATLYRVSTDYLLGCQSNKTIDVSGLTTVEMNMVANLVENMTEKNKKINNLDKD